MYSVHSMSFYGNNTNTFFRYYYEKPDEIISRNQKEKGHMEAGLLLNNPVSFSSIGCTWLPVR